MTNFYYKIFFICTNEDCNDILSEQDLDTNEYKSPLGCSCGNNAFYITLGYGEKDSNRKVGKISRSGKLKMRSGEIDPDPYLTRKESKPCLCQICKVCETCQNNFDYECIEASDFIFTLENIFTAKEEFLDSLIKKTNKAMRRD